MPSLLSDFHSSAITSPLNLFHLHHAPMMSGPEPKTRASSQASDSPRPKRNRDHEAINQLIIIWPEDSAFGVPEKYKEGLKTAAVLKNYSTLCNEFNQHNTPLTHLWSEGPLYLHTACESNHGKFNTGSIAEARRLHKEAIAAATNTRATRQSLPNNVDSSQAEEQSPLHAVNTNTDQASAFEDLIDPDLKSMNFSTTPSSTPTPHPVGKKNNMIANGDKPKRLPASGIETVQTPVAGQKRKEENEEVLHGLNTIEKSHKRRRLTDGITATDPITPDRVRSLNPGACLNDTVICSVLRLFEDKSIQVLDPSWATAKPPVVRAEKELKQTLIIPIELQKHWFVVVVVSGYNIVTCYDSQSASSEKTQAATTAIQNILDKTSFALPQDWTVKVLTPQRQPNGYDCGVFTVINAVHAVHTQVGPHTDMPKLNGEFWRSVFSSLLNKSPTFAEELAQIMSLGHEDTLSPFLSRQATLSHASLVLEELSKSLDVAVGAESKELALRRAELEYMKMDDQGLSNLIASRIALDADVTNETAKQVDLQQRITDMEKSVKAQASAGSKREEKLQNARETLVVVRDLDGQSREKLTDHAKETARSVELAREARKDALATYETAEKEYKDALDGLDEADDCRAIARVHKLEAAFQSARKNLKLVF